MCIRDREEGVKKEGRRWRSRRRRSGLVLYLFIQSPAFYQPPWRLLSKLSNELSLASQSYLNWSQEEAENGAFNIMSRPIGQRAFLPYNSARYRTRIGGNTQRRVKSAFYHSFLISLISMLKIAAADWISMAYFKSRPTRQYARIVIKVFKFYWIQDISPEWKSENNFFKLWKGKLFRKTLPYLSNLLKINTCIC